MMCVLAFRSDWIERDGGRVEVSKVEFTRSWLNFLSILLFFPPITPFPPPQLNPFRCVEESS